MTDFQILVNKDHPLSKDSVPEGRKERVLPPQPKNKIKSYSHNDCRIYSLLKNALKLKNISQISVKHIKKTEKMEKTESYKEIFL